VLDERGSLTLVGAGSARSALPQTSFLAAVNNAVEAAVPPLARELAPRRVSAVSPGVIDTRWWDFLDEDQREATFQQLSEQAPVGRVAHAEEIAHAICELIENDYITGVVLPCDGGLRLT
jgi:NAD(P)-dependent dehydrogenase (short-subunit alcohol dehydrogenase family)